MKFPLTALIVEDHWTVRDSMREFLESHMIAVHQADSHDEALTLFNKLGDNVDVAIVDIVLPREADGRAAPEDNLGVETARELRALKPDLGIVFYSSYEDRRREVFELDGAGSGSVVYLHKGSKPQELLDAIHTAARNLTGFEIAFTPQKDRPTTVELALSTLSDEERDYILPALDLLPSLTESEQAVLEHIGACQTNSSAAADLSLAPRTIDSHRANIYSKLHLRDCKLNQAALIAKIYSLNQLIQIEQSLTAN